MIAVRLGVLAVLGLAVGCGGTDPAASNKGPAKAPATPVKEVATDAPKVHDHSGWWCDEHGIKEEECSMCSSKVAKAFQDKGDWCKEHDRAKSQCFICDPGLKDKFAADYRAKYGKEPPAPTANMPAKDGKKG